MQRYQNYCMFTLTVNKFYCFLRVRATACDEKHLDKLFSHVRGK